MGYGYSPFDPGFGGFQFEDPMEEERKKRELEEAEATSLRQAMDTEPSWDQPDIDVGGRLEDVEEPEKSTGSIDDTSSVAKAASEGDGDYITRFEENLANRPEREDYEPGTLRKILSVIGGTLAGGDPNVTRSLAGYGKYDEDMANWEAEQSGLGDVVGYREAQEKEAGLGVGREYARDTAREQHERGVTGLGQDLVGLQLRAAELQQQIANEGRDDVRADAQLELDTIQKQINQQLADASTSRAATFKMGTEARAARPPDVTTMNPTQQDDLEIRALQDVILANPAFEKFVRFDDAGNPIGFSGMGVSKKDPEAMQLQNDPMFQEFMMAIEASRQKRGGMAGLQSVEPIIPQ